MPVQEIRSKQHFDELIASGKVILVDFYADWCGPCKQISPVFHKLAKEHADRQDVEFYQADIDNLQDLAAALSIRSIPTFHAFKDGNRLDQLVGARSVELTSFVQKSTSVA